IAVMGYKLATGLRSGHNHKVIAVEKESQVGLFALLLNMNPLLLAFKIIGFDTVKRRVGPKSLTKKTKGGLNKTHLGFDHRRFLLAWGRPYLAAGTILTPFKCPGLILQLFDFLGKHLRKARERGLSRL